MARNLARLDPFAELNAVQKRFVEDGVFTPLQRNRRPTTDVYIEDGNRLTVEAHLPQFDEKDITVDIDQCALVIQAERHEKTEECSFYRRIALQEQAAEGKIDAHFTKGELKVTVPFKELPTPKKIAVTADAPEAQ